MTHTHQKNREIGMPAVTGKFAAASIALAVFAASTSAALAQKKYDTGATDTEIKIGNIMPYSGPASAYGIIGRTEAAYFKKINDEGGINGRKINFISYAVFCLKKKTKVQDGRLRFRVEVRLVYYSLVMPPNTVIN